MWKNQLGDIINFCKNVRLTQINAVTFCLVGFLGNKNQIFKPLAHVCILSIVEKDEYDFRVE